MWEEREVEHLPSKQVARPGERAQKESATPESPRGSRPTPIFLSLNATESKIRRFFGGSMVLYLRLFLVDDLKVCSAFITLSVLWIGKRPTTILGATLEALSLGDRHGCPPFFWIGGGMPLARLRQGQHTGGGLHVAQGAANRCNPCFPWQSPPRQH